MNEIYTGKVIWFKKVGMGFIEWEKEGIKQQDMFVHYSDIDMDGFRMLLPNQKVTFGVGVNYEGRPKAINVKVVE